MTVITRFAPSPTGYLHIGSARTALFNYLFSKHHGGKFLLRIEDTDRERSTPEAVDTIFQSLSWLGLTWDEEPIFQFSRAPRHAEVAHQLVREGKAYYCHCTPEEVEKMREEARLQGKTPRYDGRCRNRPQPETPPTGLPVRFKMPEDGQDLTIQDLVQGPVTLNSAQLDDLILLRGDGTPTYMLSVVVDDHDMGITHVIRGDDHLTNAFRQHYLYQSCGWAVPEFAHIPLIHGADGAKLSKRHGALGAEAYRDMGFLPEAMCNYLVRLGWSHGDEEIIPMDKAIEWFGLDHVGRSPARFDITKLTHINAHYIKEASNERLLELILPLLTEKLTVDAVHKSYISKGMAGLKSRAKTILELAQSAAFYVAPSRAYDEKALLFTTNDHRLLIEEVAAHLQNHPDWSEKGLEEKIRHVAGALGQKLGNIAQPLRVALTGSTVSPSVFEIMSVLGSEEALRRLREFAA